MAAAGRPCRPYGHRALFLRVLATACCVSVLAVSHARDPVTVQLVAPFEDGWIAGRKSQHAGGVAQRWLTLWFVTAEVVEVEVVLCVSEAGAAGRSALRSADALLRAINVRALLRIDGAAPLEMPVTAAAPHVTVTRETRRGVRVGDDDDAPCARLRWEVQGTAHGRKRVTVDFTDATDGSAVASVGAHVNIAAVKGTPWHDALTDGGWDDPSRPARDAWRSPPPRLSFAPLTRTLGPQRAPRADQPLPSLVAVFAGESGRALVRQTVSVFHAAGGFEVIIFAYDDADWSELPDDVVVVRAHRQLKYWFVKRFMSPPVVADGAYEYVFLVDEDVDVSKFDPVSAGKPKRARKHLCSRCRDRTPGRPRSSTCCVRTACAWRSLRWRTRGRRSG